MSRFASSTAPARSKWRDASVLVKGVAVILLPVSVMLSCSLLVVTSEGQRTQAHVQQEAAEKVEVGVANLREAARTAETTMRGYATTPTPQVKAAIELQLTAWKRAVDALDAAALAQPDATLQRAVRALHASSDQLVALTHGFLARPSPVGSALLVRGLAIETQFEKATEDISTRAAGRARAFADLYVQSSEKSGTVILFGGVVGSVFAVLAILAFALTIRRRVRQLERNARALGSGQPLQELKHATDELGQLGTGLEDAAALLRDREQELHDAADTVRQSEQRLSLALASGAMGAWDVDLVSYVSTWDSQCQRDHGLTPGSFGGTFEAWLDLVHPDDRAHVLSAGGDVQAHGGRWSTEYRTLHPDGDVRWIESFGQAVLGLDGVPVRLVGVCSDITDRKLSQDVLRLAIEEAEGANRTKNDFLSRVSHELRTPLNAILGFGQLLELDELNESQRESVDQVLRGGRHLLALIDDVLDISRIESGDLPLSVEATAVDELLSESIALVSGIARDTDVKIEVVPGPWLGSHVQVDRRRLKQILLNLLSNGVKYNRPGGRVSLRCESPAPGVVKISVHDTGIGIPADRLVRLFTPFDRLGAESTAVDGTGIGLALSQRLAETMGTTLTVESSVGEGTTFSIELPFAEDPLSESALEIPTDQPATACDEPGGTILYVEDNPSNLRLVQRLLDRRGGTRLLSAPTGVMALSLAARVPIDVILLDLHLPDMHGSDVLRRLRDNPATATTPIIVVSADATPGQLERLRAQGADSFLAKPFDLAEFAQALDTHLAIALATT